MIKKRIRFVIALILAGPLAAMQENQKNTTLAINSIIAAQQNDASLKDLCANLPDYLMQGDNCFSNIPGYCHLKKKIYDTLKASTRSHDQSTINNIRGACYELEAALLAQQQGEKILSFGATVSINLPIEHSLYQKLMNSGKVLSPSQKKPQLLQINQEFDLVTDKQLIECKCVDNALHKKYKKNFSRQKNVAQNIHACNGYVSLKNGDGKEENINLIANKPIVCFVKYADPKSSFSKLLNLFKKTTEKKQPPASQEDIESPLLKSPLKKFAAIALDQDPDAIESELVEDQGISLWNGKDYFNSLIIHNAAIEMPELEDLKKLKTLIAVIGQDNFFLHIKAKREDQAAIITRLGNVGILESITHAERKNEGLARHMSSSSSLQEVGSRKRSLSFTTSNSATNVVSQETTIAPTTPRTQSPLEDLRTPLYIAGIVFTEIPATPQKTGVLSSPLKNSVRKRLKLGSNEQQDVIPKTARKLNFDDPHA